MFLDCSYERYYTSQLWNYKYLCGHNFRHPKEDCRYGSIAALLRQYSNGGPILDAGCGDGELEDECRGSGLHLIGIDYSCIAIAKAQQRSIPHCHFVCSDVRTFSSDQTFSIIVFNESLYYIDAYLESLYRLGRLLRTEGVFIVSMFDTLITRRIWKTLQNHLRIVEETLIRDDTSRIAWNIRVLQRPRSRQLGRFGGREKEFAEQPSDASYPNEPQSTVP